MELSIELTVCHFLIKYNMFIPYRIWGRKADSMEDRILIADDDVMISSIIAVY